MLPQCFKLIAVLKARRTILRDFSRRVCIQRVKIVRVVKQVTTRPTAAQIVDKTATRGELVGAIVLYYAHQQVAGVQFRRKRSNARSQFVPNPW